MPLLALLGATLAVAALSGFRYALGPFTLDVSVRPALRGVTRLEIPPAGEVRARTHRAPLTLGIRLERVDIDALQRLAAEHPGRGELTERLRRDARALGRYVAGRVAALGFVGGALGALAAVPGDHRAVAAGAATGLAAAGGAVALTAADYDPAAFGQPEFHGALRAAPWLIGVVEESLARLPELGLRFQRLAEHLLRLFQRLDALPPLAAPAGELTVLVVADLHNNPVAVDFIVRIVELFAPDLVVDAGDITDYGTGLEAVLLEELGALPVPYLLVPGNHDGPEALAQLEQLPNVLVLRGGVQRVAGLAVAGLADPGADSPSPALPTEEEVEAGRAALEALLRGFPERPPDLLVVHNPAIGRGFFGRVPVLVTGHTHRPQLRIRGGSVWVDPGSAGAAGIRGLEGSANVSYSLAILHLARAGEGWRAVAVDTVRVDPAEAGYRVERHLVPPTQAADAP